MAVVEMLSWLSSGAAWFVFLNVIVGAIAVVSWLGHGAGGTASTPSSASARRRLARTASTVVMERLRSVANFPFQYLSGDYSATPLHVHGDVSSESDYFYYPREAEEEAVAAAPFRPEPPAPVKEVVAATTLSMAAPPSSPVAAATAAAIKNEEEEAEAEEEEEESISLDEAYALAQQAQPQPQPRAPRSAPDAAAAAKAADAKPRRARAEEVEEGKAEVNARAERFIQQFREDLKLQRINSIINYTNALRRRGVVGGVAATAPAPAR